jgi:hypothetical protein
VVEVLVKDGVAEAITGELVPLLQHDKVVDVIRDTGRLPMVVVSLI